MIDLNHQSGAHDGPKTFADRVNAVIDAALLERRKKEPIRNYLGMSQIGEPCLRKLYYGYTHTPVDHGRELTARAIRIFDTGHAGEDAIALQMGGDSDSGDDFFKSSAARWMKDANFKLLTRDERGQQFGVSVLGGRYAGHIDGKVISGPLTDEIPYPVGWEHKALNVKNWNKIKKHGLKEASPLYYGQLQQYMPYMELGAFLFSATNKNTQELNHELVVYDPKDAQALSDKAVTIIRAAESGEILPRCTDNPDFYLCLFCDFKWRCWNADV